MYFYAWQWRSLAAKQIAKESFYFSKCSSAYHLYANLTKDLKSQTTKWAALRLTEYIHRIDDGERFVFSAWGRIDSKKHSSQSFEQKKMIKPLRVPVFWSKGRFKVSLKGNIKSFPFSRTDWVCFCFFLPSGLIKLTFKGFLTLIDIQTNWTLMLFQMLGVWCFRSLAFFDSCFRNHL